MRIEILRTVIERLLVEATPENDNATKFVVASYNNRIATIRDWVDIEPPSSTQLRIQVINHQANALIEDIEARNVDPYEGFAYLRTLLHQKNLLTHTKQRFLSIQMLLMSIVRFFRELKNRFLALLNNESMKENLMQHQVRMICEQEAIRYLHSLVDNPNYPSEVVAKLLIAHERVLAALQSDAGRADHVVEQATTNSDSIQRMALQIELEVVDDYYASGNISRAEAKKLRDNVSLMMLDLDDHI